MNQKWAIPERTPPLTENTLLPGENNRLKAGKLELLQQCHVALLYLYRKPAERIALMRAARGVGRLERVSHPAFLTDQLVDELVLRGWLQFVPVTSPLDGELVATHPITRHQVKAELTDDGAAIAAASAKNG
jgi:hypothetical protein